MYFINIIRNFRVSVVNEISEIISSSVINMFKILLLVRMGFLGVFGWFFINMGIGKENFFLYRWW